MKKQNRYIVFLIFFWTISIAHAQITENPFAIEFSGTKITLLEPFTVSIKVTGLDQVPLISFPDNIKNFQKRESSRSSLTNQVGGKTIITYTVSQNYYPTKTGIFNTGPLEILVNKQIMRSEGTTVTVEQSSDVESDETEEESPEINAELEREASQGVFLAVSVDKRQVYVQQGFNLRLSLLVSEDNAAELDFYEVEKQLEKVLKLLKPANCWEENFGIQEIPDLPITIKGKRFTEYRIYQASFFPLNNQSITIPSVSWMMKMMTKSEEEKDIVELKTYSSKPLVVEVLSLPAHPLRNQVIVGNFRLEEKISSNQLKTGTSYRYNFRIVGEGNIQSIQEPTFTNMVLFDIYPPDIENNIIRQKNRIAGAKTFQYQIIPKQSGSFLMNDLVFWVYFNPKKQMYDTLRSTLNLTVIGENVQNTQLETADAESVYTGIEQWDSTKPVVDYQTIIRNIANILIIIMLIVMIFMFRK
ncbi:BatD family protein [Runella sp.]|uniref:BatD family protein n=1 Tax=Runella sp. TaxID=1960881 RepID=UPI003D0E4CA5